MYSLDDLIKHLKITHSIVVNQKQRKDLRNIGYYHGYKGYRFVRKATNVINFTNFDQVVSLNRFDLDLKTLLYPKVMFIENALKSYLIESILKDSQSENLTDIYSKSITNYKSFQKGSKKYIKEFQNRMSLQMHINSALIRDYQKGRDIENHFFNNDKPIPVWAVFESLSLGEFGNFFTCSNLNVKINTSNLLGLPTNLDSDGALISHIIYALKDLRNSIAHNGIIFDTRFKTASINSRLVDLLTQETNILNIDFNYIDSYFVLIIYICRIMGQTRKECIGTIHEYNNRCEYLFKNIPQNIYFQILGSGHLSLISKLEEYVKNS